MKPIKGNQEDTSTRNSVWAFLEMSEGMLGRTVYNRDLAFRVLSCRPLF